MQTRERSIVEIAPYIDIDPDIHHGKPVISGARVPVSLAIGSLASGKAIIMPLSKL